MRFYTQDIDLLPSRKNKVTLYRTNGVLYIRKRFSGEERLNKELEIHGMLGKAGLNVVKLAGQNPGELEYDFIDAPTFLDILEDYERGSRDENGVYSAFERLLFWLKCFWEVTGQIFFDINLRNFLYSGEKVLGIDFEDARAGRPETDIGRMLAFIVAYHPVFTQKKLALARHFFQQAVVYGACDGAAVREEFFLELEEMKKRRNLSVPYETARILNGLFEVAQ